MSENIAKDLAIAVVALMMFSFLPLIESVPQTKNSAVAVQKGEGRRGKVFQPLLVVGGIGYKGSTLNYRWQGRSEDFYLPDSRQKVQNRKGAGPRAEIVSLGSFPIGRE